MATTEPLREKRHVREITAFYQKRGEPRNYVLVMLCVHTALRVSDILRLGCNDIYDYQNNTVRPSISVIEGKTGKSKIIALNKGLVKALEAFMPHTAPGKALVLNRRTGKAISRVQAYRLIRAAAEALRFRRRVSCHALRKTFGYHSWKNGVPLIVIMEIYNHTSIAVTKRYLGVTQDDKNAAYLELDFSA